MKKIISYILSVFFCFCLVFSFCSCSIFDESKEIDSNDFNLPVISDEYDLLFLISIEDKKEEFDKLLREYELETGVKIKSFFPEKGQVYIDLLKSQMNSKNKPNIFLIQDEFEFNFWEKEDCLLNFSSSQRQDIKDLVLKIDKKLRPNFDTNTLCLPCFLDSYGYLVDIRVLKDLIFEVEIEKFLEDFRNCSFKEFENFIKVLSEHIKSFKNFSFKLGKNTYNLKDKRGEHANNLKSIFSLKINFDNSLDVALYSSLKELEGLKTLVRKTDTLKESLISYAKLLNLEKSNMSSVSFDFKRESKEEEVDSFLKREFLFMQGGTDDFKYLDNKSHDFKDYLRLLPLKTPYSIDSKTNISFPIFSANYIAINSKAGEKEKKMAEDFLIWFMNSNKSKEIIYDDIKKIPCNFNEEINTNIFFNYIFKQKNNNNTFASSSYRSSNTWSEAFADFPELVEYFKKRDPSEEDYKNFADVTIKIIKDVN